MIAFYRPLLVLSILPLLLCQDCGDTITPPNYSISSPNYPNNYPHRLDCTWKISVEDSSRIQLRFRDFQFAKNGDLSCSDYLQMWDGGDDEADQVFLSCAESLADFKAENNGTASFNSSGNMFYLRMTTNRRVRRRGFWATYISFSEPATTTQTIIRSTSPDAQSTQLKRTTAFALFSTWKTANSTFKSPDTTVPTNFSTNVPSTITPTDSSSKPPSSILLVVVPTVSFVLLLVCFCATGVFIHTRRSRRKSNTSSNDSSCHDVGTNPVRTVKEQCESYNKTLYYTNESFHASTQGTYPPPYQSINSADDFGTAQMNVRIPPCEQIIGDIAYESFDGEENRSSDYSANAGNVVNITYVSYDEEEIADNGDDYTANVGDATNIVYESYDKTEIADNGDYTSNTGEVANIAYESYDGKEIADNGDYAANVEEVSNIAYESHDGQVKVENDHNIFNEGKTSNVVYESYDRQENSRNSDDTENGEVSSVAYERYDGEKNVAYDADDLSMTYQTIDDSQSVDDDYYKI